MSQWSFILPIIKEARQIGDTKNAKKLIEKVQYLRKYPESGAELKRLRNLREAFDTEFSEYDPKIIKNYNGKSNAEKFNHLDDNTFYSFYEHPSQYSEEFGGTKLTTLKDLMHYYQDIRDTRKLIKNKEAYDRFVDEDYLNFINAVKEKIKKGVHPRKAAFDAIFERKNYEQSFPWEETQYFDKDYIP